MSNNTASKEETAARSSGDEWTVVEGADISRKGAATARTDRREEPMSVTALIRQLVDDLARLFRKELALASSEILHSVHDMKSGVAGVISGAAILYAGFVVLLAAAVLGLAEVVETWAAALIVGAAATLIGYLIVLSSKRKMAPSHLIPERTGAGLKQDSDVIRRQRS